MFWSASDIDIDSDDFFLLCKRISVVSPEVLVFWPLKYNFDQGVFAMVRSIFYGYEAGVKLGMVRHIVFWLLVCCFPVLLVSSVIRCAVNEICLYEYGFSKYRVSQSTGISSSDLRRVAFTLIDYFNSRVDEAQIIVEKEGQNITLFTERELIHLQDVRNLIRLNTIIQLSVLVAVAVCISVLVLLSKERWPILAKGAFAGSALTLVLVVLIALWCWIDFEHFFYLFHVVSFPNEYWMLDPNKDYLIKLFPEGFFYDGALFIFGTILVVSLMIMSGSLCALRWTGRHEPGPGITP